MNSILNDLTKCPIIAAIREIDKVDIAVVKPVKCIFLLSGDICNLKYVVKLIHKADKSVFVHLDLLEGLGKDNMGIRYIAQEIKPDGIITTKSNLINYAKNEGIFTIQRVFILDSMANDSADKSIRQVDPDAVEILPGVIPKIIRKISRSIKIPVIAGGLIETMDEVNAALKFGAQAVSTSNENLWELNARGLGELEKVLLDR